jgi:PLP dependent protein
LKKNLNKIQDKIDLELKKNKNLQKPRIVAVSKKQSIDKIIKLNEMGITDFAENYLQEALIKIQQLKDLSIKWHFIGKIQSNKIKDIVGNFYLIQSVSTLAEAQKISNIASEKNLNQKILMQVNLANETTKQGFLLEDLLVSLNEIIKLKNIQLIGMMVFPPLSETESETLKWFNQSFQLFNQLKSQLGPEFKHLSMGTSQDYHLAVRSGATDLRLGECLLGSRI